MMYEPNIVNDKMARIRLSVTITADTIQLKELDILANNAIAIQLQSTVQNFIGGVQKQIKEIKSSTTQICTNPVDSKY
jgi:small-conductance mechanosensitive channel